MTIPISIAGVNPIPNPRLGAMVASCFTVHCSPLTVVAFRPLFTISTLYNMSVAARELPHTATSVLKVTTCIQRWTMHSGRSTVQR